MDKKLLALLILASLSPAKATLTKIPAGFEVIAQGQQEYIEVLLVTVRTSPNTAGRR